VTKAAEAFDGEKGPVSKLAVYHIS